MSSSREGIECWFGGCAIAELSIRQPWPRAWETQVSSEDSVIVDWAWKNPVAKQIGDDMGCE
jgi:hypothetical protein